MEIASFDSVLFDDDFVWERGSINFCQSKIMRRVLYFVLYFLIFFFSKFDSEIHPSVDLKL